MTESNKELSGVVEWIVSEGGTVSAFNKYVMWGRIHGVPYRYFFTEGWIGLITDGRAEYAVEYKTLNEFQSKVKNEAKDEGD